jgi:thioredoxin reductase
VKFEAAAENLNSWFSGLDDIDEARAIVFVDEGNSTSVEGIFGAAMKIGDEEANNELMEGSGAISESFRADCGGCWVELDM